MITKGTWLPDRSKATDKEPPLYLHITGATQAILDAGVAAIEKLLAQEMAPLVVDHRARREEQAPRERRKWPEEHIDIGLENLRNFNVRAKIVGPQGLFVKHIQAETSARVQIKGRGSGFIESDTGRESDDPMHIHISGPEQIMVDSAKDLAEDLMQVVREEWQKAKVVMDQSQQHHMQQQYNPYAQYQQPPPPSGGAYPPPPGGEAPPPVRKDWVPCSSATMLIGTQLFGTASRWICTSPSSRCRSAAPARCQRTSSSASSWSRWSRFRRPCRTSTSYGSRARPRASAVLCWT